MLKLIYLINRFQLLASCELIGLQIRGILYWSDFSKVAWKIRHGLKLLIKELYSFLSLDTAVHVLWKPNIIKFNELLSKNTVEKLKAFSKFIFKNPKMPGFFSTFPVYCMFEFWLTCYLCLFVYTCMYHINQWIKNWELHDNAILPYSRGKGGVM